MSGESDQLSQDRGGDPAIAGQIRQLAREHDVVFQRTSLDDYAETVSRLCDDEVSLDEVQYLLIGLHRAGVISSEQQFALHATYLDQRDHAELCQGFGKRL